MSIVTGINSHRIPNHGQLNMMTVNMIKHKDNDGDNALNAKELNVHEDIFIKIDANGDGKADREELNIYYPISKTDIPTLQLIRDKDTDGDKALNAEELGIPKDTFTKIDTNGDDKADRDELNAAHPLNKSYNILAYQSYNMKNSAPGIDTTV